MPTKLFNTKIEQKLIVNLLKATKNVKIAVAWFTNPSIFEVIIDLVKKDVPVELILCDDRLNFKNPNIDFQKLIDLGGVIRVSKYPRLMHNKFCIIDSRILINGSYNWTMRAEKYNFENIVLTTDKELITDFENYFDELITETDKIVSIPYTTFYSYCSQSEIDMELKLEGKDGDSLHVSKQNNMISDEENPSIYTYEISQALDEAELLYLNAEHEKCIVFCNEFIKKHPKIPKIYLILASANWRTDRYQDLVKAAEMAINLDNEMYDAYNLLGIGYAKITGREQISIKNYNICIAEHPQETGFLRNRAITKTFLESDKNIPSKIRESFKKGADSDFEKIIELVSGWGEREQTYKIIHDRAIAYRNLGKYTLSKKDIDLALLKYDKVKDKFELDKNEYLDMKSLQRELNNIRKSKAY